MRASLTLATLLPAACLAFATQAQEAPPATAVTAANSTGQWEPCHGTDPACYNNWPRPAAEQYRILLYTRTAGPRHAELGTPLGEGLNPPLAEDNAAQREMVRIAGEQGWHLDYTEDPAQLRSLRAYHAVVFLSTSRDNLDDDAKTALRQYMRAGGGFVGIHNAFGTLYNWPWYEGLLGNTNFYDHGPVRSAEVVETGGARWPFEDEWYNLYPFPSGVRFLSTVDTATFGEAASRLPRPRGVPPPGYVPVVPVVGAHPGHGDFHPVAWCHYYDGGKAWLTTLGHDARAFEKDSGFPGAAEFQQLIVGGIKSVMGAAPFCPATGG